MSANDKVMGHTPGPWMVADRFYILMDDDVACEVAKVCEENIDDDCLGQCDADARLIAAAPDLLSALKDAYAALDYAQAQVDSDWADRMQLTRCRRRIKPVIDKAEGRSE